MNKDQRKTSDQEGFCLGERAIIRTRIQYQREAEHCIALRRAVGNADHGLAHQLSPLRV